MRGLRGIIGLLSREFMILVSAAILVADAGRLPGRAILLEDFAYRTSVDAGIFLLASITAVVVAMLTVLYQAVTAGLVNPSRSLRYE